MNSSANPVSIFIHTIVVCLTVLRSLLPSRSLCSTHCRNGRHQALPLLPAQPASSHRGQGASHSILITSRISYRLTMLLPATHVPVRNDAWPQEQPSWNPDREENRGDAEHQWQSCQGGRVNTIGTTCLQFPVR